MSFEKNPTIGAAFDLFGPTVAFLTAPDDVQQDFCVMKGTMPPGVTVPLHSHPDTEDFFVISGTLEVLKSDAAGYTWVSIHEGEYLHLSDGTPHAWRNTSNAPVVLLLITTKTIGRFFQEVKRPATRAPQPPTREELAHFAAVSARYGYWNATPEENAAVGIQLSF